MRAQRAVAIVGGFLAVATFVVIAGTVFESRWTGDLGACSRALDIDGSTMQQGDASVALLPPHIHCTYAVEPNFRKRAATDDRVAYFGIAIVAAFVTAGFVMFGLTRWVKAEGRAEIRI